MGAEVGGDRILAELADGVGAGDGFIAIRTLDQYEYARILAWWRGLEQGVGGFSCVDFFGDLVLLL